VAPTPATNGTCLLNETRTEYLRNRYSQISDPALLSDPTTPQGQAFVFMTETDPLFPDVCTYPTLDQRYGMATLYYSTQGDTWNDKTNWLGDTIECEWYGVVCFDSPMAANMTLGMNTNSTRVCSFSNIIQCA
jgi:hypothetical protein